MTVPVPDQLEYISDANGVTKDFPYPKRFLQKDEIVVALRDADGIDTPQILDMHYTIAGSSWPTGGTVSFINAPQAPNKVVRYRMTQAKQTIGLANNQRNDAPSVELQLDRLTMAIQDRGRLGEAAWWGLLAEVAARVQGDKILNIRVDKEIIDRIAGDEALASLIGNVGSGNAPLFDTNLAVSMAIIAPLVNAIRTGGYYAVGDGGAALYKRVFSEPTHAGKVQSADGAWWELSEDIRDLRAMGVKFDGAWGAGDVYTGTDNTDAINAAFAFRQDWIAPAGVCLTRGGHIISGSLTGAGVWDTTFVCTSDDPSTKVFTLHTLARIDLFRTLFNGDVDLASATDEQFVALAFGTSELPLCKGGGYGNIAIGRCGTAMWSGNNFTFACRFDNLEARDFTYRLLDVPAGLRTPNKWGNIYASGPADRIDIDVAINQSGLFSDGDHFGVVHIEKINFNSIMRFSGCAGTRVDVVHLEDVNPKASDRCLFEHREGATGHYGRVSIWYSVIKNNCTLFGGWLSKRRGDTSARLIDQDAFIRVDHLELNGLYGDEARTLPVNTVTGFKAFNNYIGEVGGGVWYAGVSEYTWYSYNSSDDAWYKAIGIDDDNMRIERFGKIKMPDELKGVRTLTASGKLGRLDNIIIVSASGGNVVITLPKTITGKSREILIRRVDTSGNTVSYAAQSGDTVNVANTPSLGTTRIISDGFSGWLQV